MNRSLRLVALTAGAAVALSGCAAVGPVVGLHDAPAAVTSVAPLTPAHARDIVSRAFTAASQAGSTTGAAADKARATAYTGSALTAAAARTGLDSVQPGLGGSSPALSPSQPGLLALSRGFGWPRAMVAQTVPSGGSLPVLHLLTSPDALTPYRIAASATMLPNSTVRRFDPLPQGSRLLTDGTDLAVAPTALVTQYAGSLSFPARTVADPAFTADPFAGQVRQNATTQAASVAVQSGFTQRHDVVPGSTYAVAAGSRRSARLLGAQAHRHVHGQEGPEPDRAEGVHGTRPRPDTDHVQGDHDHPGVRRVRGAGEQR